MMQISSFHRWVLTVQHLLQNPETVSLVDEVIQYDYITE
jgi:hypothetical protein